MTIYAFYYTKPDPRYQNILMGDKYAGKPYLYAYTTDKDLAEEFKAQRNMKNFLFVKEPDVSKKELSKFESINRKRALDYRSYHTYGEDKIQKMSVKVLSTADEEETVYRDAERIFQIFQFDMFDVKILKTKYMKALQKLLYVDLYLFFTYNYVDEMDAFYRPYALYGKFGEEGMIKSEQLHMDYMKILLKIFKDTFYHSKENDND